MENVNEQPVKAPRETVVERVRVKRPDKNFDNDDELYSAIAEDYDNYDNEIGGYRKNEDMLIKSFEADPKIAQLFISMAQGENPFLYLIENFGDEFREALENPEIKDRIVERHNKYIEHVARNKKLEEESKANLAGTLDALNEAKAMLGCSDEDADKAFARFQQILDDAIVDKVDRDTWVMFLKGVKHDEDVAAAAYEGEVRGRNAKIDTLKMKRSVPANLPPQIGGTREIPEKKKINIEGALARYGGDRKSIWDK